VTEWVLIRSGDFRMGSDDFYREEGPVHLQQASAFELSRYAVTNREFAAFANETGYVTVAERSPDPAAFGNTDRVPSEPGSLVFTPTNGPVDLGDWRQWWMWMPGASWRHPRGPGSDLGGRDDHPVVQIAYDDANAYAAWAGGRLPTEVEWEYAARGGLDGARFAWGDDPNDGMRANTWQGSFPYANTGAGTQRWIYTAPVGSFPPNGYGLFEMTGNTWEWTSSIWTSRHGRVIECACGPHAASERVKQRVLKGGSHLCSPDYCVRYRPAARSAQSEDSAATHIGMRIARDVVA
jgi:sulfatase modifying factor 1